MEKASIHLQSFVDWMRLRNYADSTKQSYTSRVRRFLLWRQHQGLSGDVSAEEVQQFLVFRSDRNLSWQSINGDHSALQMFFNQVLKRSWPIAHLPRPRKEKTLPTILSREEVQRLINAGTMLKHQVFMALLYGTGLRLSEALDVEISHIDGQRQQLRVVKGKGKKDRYVNLPEAVLLLLRDYYRSCKPVKYLFNGSYRGSRWANRSAQVAVEQAAIHAKIIRPVSPHVLRHCYATHHLEGGTSLIYLRDQMGHRNVKTTARYIHLCADYHKSVAHPVAELELQLRQPNSELL